MATRVTDGARRERLPRACIALTKSEEKESLLAVYVLLCFIQIKAHSNVLCPRQSENREGFFFFAGSTLS